MKKHQSITTKHSWFIVCFSLSAILALALAGCDTGGGEEEPSNWYASLSGLEAYPADGGALLAWSEDSATNDYQVWYGTGDLSSAQQADTTVNLDSPRAGIATASIDGGLENGTTYNIWVKAINGNNKEPVSCTVTPQSAVDITKGTDSITKGGIYKLPAAPDSTATVITVSTTAPVTITGSGVGDGVPENSALQGYSIKYSVAGANLTIRDMYLATKDNTSNNLIEFTGDGNTLTITGTSLLEDASGKACINVPESAALTINGLGTLYMYKKSGAAGIGGNQGPNGKITFKDITFFGKTTHPAALIGASSSYNQGGDITFLSGEYTMEANAKGPCIGAGSWDAAQAAGVVYIKGGTFNFNINFSGPAIGTSNSDPTKQGIVHISGGSIRVFVDENAASSWSYITGVDDTPIKAEKKNAEDEDTTLLKFDLRKVSAAPAYNVLVDGVLFYTGGPHIYSYGGEHDTSFQPDTTLDNWQKEDSSYEPRLFFFLTKQTHTIKVNGQSFTVNWDGTKFTGDCVWQPGT